MSTKEIKLADLEKKFSNPIGELVQTACTYDCKILLEEDNKQINAKSIMGIMAFDFHKGNKVTIVTEGTDETEALTAMAAFLS